MRVNIILNSRKYCFVVQVFAVFSHSVFLLASYSAFLLMHKYLMMVGLYVIRNNGPPSAGEHKHLNRGAETDKPGQTGLGLN